MGHYGEMLKLNPGYNDDCAADWLYTKALLAFHREGACAQTAATLREAMKRSKHAPDCLTGKKFKKCCGPVTA